MSERRGGPVVAVEVMPGAESGHVADVVEDAGSVERPERIESGLAGGGGGDRRLDLGVEVSSRFVRAKGDHDPRRFERCCRSRR